MGWMVGVYKSVGRVGRYGGTWWNYVSSCVFMCLPSSDDWSTRGKMTHHQNIPKTITGPGSCSTFCLSNNCTPGRASSRGWCWYGCSQAVWVRHWEERRMGWSSVLSLNLSTKRCYYEYSAALSFQGQWYPQLSWALTIRKGLKNLMPMPFVLGYDTNMDKVRHQPNHQINPNPLCTQGAPPRWLQYVRHGWWVRTTRGS